MCLMNHSVYRSIIIQYINSAYDGFVHVVHTFRCRGYYTRSDRRAGGLPIHRCFPHLLSSGRWPPTPGLPPVGTATPSHWSPYSPDGTNPSRTLVLRICGKRQEVNKIEKQFSLKIIARHVILILIISSILDRRVLLHTIIMIIYYYN